MGRLPAVLLAAVVGCYHGNPEQACHVRCTPGGPCPSNLACQGDGLCHNPDGTCPADLIDADLRPDVPPDEYNPNCYGTGLLKFCVDAPTTPLVISSPKTINTSTTNADCTVVNVDGMGNKVCLVLVSAFTISNAATLSATGTYPLAIISDSTIALSGFIDVSGQKARSLGGDAAGANLGCSAGVPPRIQVGGTISAGGGAGGSSGTQGASGGASNAGMATGGVPGAAFATNPSPGFVRGGCDGQPGAMYMDPAPAGKGGGAVYLIARTSIHFNNQGWIDASGGSAETTGFYAGGGGGGAGGLIALDAPTIDTSTGYLMADGGAGACGSNAALQGTAGHLLGITTPTVQAQGGCMGDATNVGGAGGAGAAVNGGATSGQGAIVGVGGGGGGGGLGYLLVYGGNSTLGPHSPDATNP